jgi:hypothetical protein
MREDPKVIDCVKCNAKVELTHHFINTCPNCGQDYDGSGNSLAPRINWGEETGENWTDIVYGNFTLDDLG